MGEEERRFENNIYSYDPCNERGINDACGGVGVVSRGEDWASRRRITWMSYDIVRGNLIR